MIGPYKDYAISYNQYASLNLIRETMLGLMLGKKHKPEKMIDFHDMYPTIDDYMYQGQGKAIRASEKQRKGSLAVKAAAIFVDDSAPAWLKEAV